MKAKSNSKSIYLKISRADGYILKYMLENSRHKEEAQFNRYKREVLIDLLTVTLEN